MLYESLERPQRPHHTRTDTNTTPRHRNAAHPPSGRAPSCRPIAGLGGVVHNSDPAAWLAALFTIRIRLRCWRELPRGLPCCRRKSCGEGLFGFGDLSAACFRSRNSRICSPHVVTRHPAPGTRADEFEATYRGTTGADAATAAKYGASAAWYAEPVQAPPLGQHSRRRRSPDRQRPRRSP